MKEDLLKIIENWTPQCKEDPANFYMKQIVNLVPEFENAYVGGINDALKEEGEKSMKNEDNPEKQNGMQWWYEFEKNVFTKARITGMTLVPIVFNNDYVKNQLDKWEESIDKKIKEKPEEEKNWLDKAKESMINNEYLMTEIGVLGYKMISSQIAIKKGKNPFYEMGKNVYHLVKNEPKVIDYVNQEIEKTH